MESGIRKRNHGITETETETEYGIRERRFQAIDLKKNVSNDNKINKTLWERIFGRGCTRHM